MIKPGDVLFVWGDGFIDKGIEFVTHGPSHCAIFLTESTLAEAQIGRTVGDVSLQDYMDKANRLEVWTDDTLTDEDRVKMVEFAKSLYGIHYDIFLIPLEFIHFEFGAQIDWYHAHKHLICSGYLDRIALSVKHAWSHLDNPAPVDLQEGGVLRLEEVLKDA